MSTAVGTLAKIIQHVEGMPRVNLNNVEDIASAAESHQAALNQWQEKLRDLIGDLSITVTSVASLVK